MVRFLRSLASTRDAAEAPLASSMATGLTGALVAGGLAFFHFRDAAEAALLGLAVGVVLFLAVYRGLERERGLQSGGVRTDLGSSFRTHVVRLMILFAAIPVGAVAALFTNSAVAFLVVVAVAIVSASQVGRR
jgi:hypothetical protein